MIPAAQQALSNWLGALGLQPYLALFVDNEVGLDAMRLLDEADLRELSLPLGPRKMLLRAITELNATEPSAASASLSALVVPPTPAAASAQRRQLTVLFCDLVGSTPLSRVLDPEDLRELMGRYQAAARAVIARYDGHIAQYRGDGVLVYFGWPRSHGDDARRALRAALDLLDAVACVKTHAPLAVRIGVATGVVVVGRTEGGDEPQTAVGETPNLAARLQALGEPGAIVVAGLTRTLAGDGFTYRDLGTQTLKGIDEPVQAFAVSGAQHTQDAQGERVGSSEQIESDSRGLPDDVEPPGARMPPHLVGRDEEIGLLRRAW